MFSKANSPRKSYVYNEVLQNTVCFKLRRKTCLKVFMTMLPWCGTSVEIFKISGNKWTTKHCSGEVESITACNIWTLVRFGNHV